MRQHEHYMRQAIVSALKNPSCPFGTVLVDRATDRVVADGVNRTRENPTWHGELDAINKYASSRTQSNWSQLDLYTTAEPCPMCQAAIVWSGISRVFYGTSIAKLAQLGWHQIDIAAEEVTRRAPFAKCQLVGGVLRSECDQLFLDALGTVAEGSIKDHAKRLDVERDWQLTTRPLQDPVPRVAVIGAGVSGLMCARTLQDHGFDVTVFEKSRSVGGRMATRRTDEGPHFDHGAQYFTARDERFESYVNSWVHDGIASSWEGRICTLSDGRIEWKENTTRRFVGVPGMNAICRHLAAGLSTQFRTLVGPPKREKDIWLLSDHEGRQLGEYEFVITSAPAPQSAQLLAAVPDLRQRAELTKMNGCWAVMLAFDRSLDLAFDGAFVHQSPLSWIARNSSKPERGTRQESWVLHASPEWTSQCLEKEPEEVLPKLIDAFWQANGATPRKPSFKACHRWRYAIPPDPLESQCLFDPPLGIGACGDWCGGPRVEGAFLSGIAVADRVLAHVADAE